MASKISYVEIELNSKDKKRGIRRGIFVGFTKDKDNIRFINISHNKSCTFCSENYYNVLSINIRYNTTSRQVFFKNNEQTQAFNYIKETMIQLRELEMCDSEGVINLKEYSNLPKKYGKDGLFNTGGNITHITNPKKEPFVNPPAVVTPPATTTPPYYPPEKKKTEATYIRRRTAKPTEEFLKQLKKKVALISKDLYDAADIPEVSDDTNDTISPAARTATMGQEMRDDYHDNYPNAGWGEDYRGMMG